VIDTRVARAFLASHLGRDPGAVELVGEGEWSRCFAFTADGAERVVRFGQHRDDFEKDRLAAFHGSTAVPVPAVLDIGPIFDGWFAISTRARGIDLGTLDERGWQRVLPALRRALEALGSVDLSTTSGCGVWDATGDAPHPSWAAFLMSVIDDPVEHRTHGWSRRLAASVVGDASLRRGIDALREVADAYTGPRRLAHADLINRNVLVDKERIAAFLDWGCSLYGDPLYDVAWLEVWSPWHAGLGAIDIRRELLDDVAALGDSFGDVGDRMRACSLRILVDALGYCAFVGRTDDLVAIDAQLTTLLAS
jgi:hygromycin-B 4-O-kinase